MFRKAIVSGVMVAILVTAFLVSPLVPETAEAAQYSPPWAVRNTFVYPSGGGDSTTVDSAFQAYVGDYAGYGDYVFHQRSAAVAVTSVFPTLYRGMPHDAIYSFFGHGVDGGGYLVFWSGSSYSLIRAHQTMSNLGYSASSLNQVTDLWDLRLMVLSACNSAHRSNPSLWYTSLTEQAASMGVDCALGFINYIYSPYIENWEVYFWQALGTYTNTASWAAFAAADIVNYYFGGYGGVDSYAIAGNGSITIRPATYGT